MEPSNGIPSSTPQTGSTHGPLLCERSSGSQLLRPCVGPVGPPPLGPPPFGPPPFGPPPFGPPPFGLLSFGPPLFGPRMGAQAGPLMGSGMGLNVPPSGQVSFHHPPPPPRQPFHPQVTHSPQGPQWLPPIPGQDGNAYHQSSSPHASICFGENVETVKSMSTLISKDLEDTWIFNWMRDRNILPHKNQIQSEKPVSVSEVSKNVKVCVIMLQQLSEQSKVLYEGRKTMNNSTWREKWTKVENMKKEVSKRFQLFSDSSRLLALKNLLMKRSRKRCRQKLRSSKRRENLQLTHLRRQQLHKEADAWLTDMQRSVEKARKDEELCHKADSILSEVSRRQTEGRRQLALLEALCKLRSARAQAAEARGDKLSTEQHQEAKHFSQVIDWLRNLWTNHLKEYAAEEQSLRVMLEASAAQEDTIEMQQAQSILDQWEECLFGTVGQDTVYGVETLLAIRHAWDFYSVPQRAVVSMASAIPVGWVLPTTPSSSSWQKYVQSDHNAQT